MACRRRNRRIETPVAHHRLAADQFDLVRQGRHVLLDVVRPLVGEHLEVAELAALAAERDVQVQPQRHGGRRLLHRVPALRSTCSRFQQENGG